jgi:hypothetical protein
LWKEAWRQEVPIEIGRGEACCWNACYGGSYPIVAGEPAARLDPDALQF